MNFATACVILTHLAMLASSDRCSDAGSAYQLKTNLDTRTCPSLDTKCTLAACPCASSCCVMKTGICQASSKACNAGYFKDPEKHATSVGDNFNKNCCTERAKCKDHTCPTDTTKNTNALCDIGACTHLQCCKPTKCSAAKQVDSNLCGVSKIVDDEKDAEPVVSMTDALAKCCKNKLGCKDYNCPAPHKLKSNHQTMATMTESGSEAECCEPGRKTCHGAEEDKVKCKTGHVYASSKAAVALDDDSKFDEVCCMDGNTCAVKNTNCPTGHFKDPAKASKVIASGSTFKDTCCTQNQACSTWKDGQGGGDTASMANQHTTSTIIVLMFAAFPFAL